MAAGGGDRDLGDLLRRPLLSLSQRRERPLGGCGERDRRGGVRDLPPGGGKGERDLLPGGGNGDRDLPRGGGGNGERDRPPGGGMGERDRRLSINKAKVSYKIAAHYTNICCSIYTVELAYCGHLGTIKSVLIIKVSRSVDMIKHHLGP